LLGLLALLSVLPAAPVTAAGGEGRVTATVRVNPLLLTVEAPERVTTGRGFKIEAVVSNWGPVTLREVQATLYPPEGLTVQGNTEKRLGNLQGGMTKKAAWRGQAEGPGVYVVLVIASAVDSETGAAVTAQGTANIIAEGGSERGWRTPPLPPGGDYPGRTTPPLPPGEDYPGGTVPPPPQWEDEDDRGHDPGRGS